MMTCFILEASRPDGSEYRIVFTFCGPGLHWLARIFGL